MEAHEKNLVFVYGTLRRHEANHDILNGAHCLAQQAWTKGLLYDTGLGYPALKAVDKGTVYGELYEVNFQQLKNLDELEDYIGPGQNNLYNRVKHTVITDNGPVEAFVYCIHPKQEEILTKLIPFGDWRIYHNFKASPTFHYFAYGSCMDQERFVSAGVDHYFRSIVGVGVLNGYTLGYTRRVSDGGRADIMELGGVVEGVVYEVAEPGLAYLYRREGVKYRSYRPALIDVTINGRLLKNVLTFLVVNKEPNTAPPLDYAEEIIRGGSLYLSPGYIEKLKQQLKEQFNLDL